MEISTAKWLPRGVALAVAGCVAWPSLSALLPESAAKPRKPPDAVALVAAPAQMPHPKRNPFGARGSKKQLPRSQGKVDGVGSASYPKLGANGSDGLDAFRLEATCIVGDRRLAVINGRLYAPDEPLIEPPRADSKAAPKGVAAEPLVVGKIVDVMPYKVLLECQGKTLELSYSDIPASSRSGTPNRNHSGSKSSRAPKSRR
ncbi:MAG: hypothetical protein ABFC96_04750 [Thermoguttaceae bacterium]